MPERSFVHLHCHTHYSLLDGASRIPELVERVKGLGMNACAMTDHGNLYGAIEFYRECKAAGVNPVIGYEAYVAPTKRSDREARRRGDAGYHLTLLARDVTGFKNLVKMSSAAFLEGFHYVPRIDKELLEAHHEGLICLSGCASGEFSEYLLKEDLDAATKLAEWFARLFGKHFYVEIQNNGLQIQRKCAEGAIEVANRLGLPLVATSDAHYLRREDANAHDVLLCINTRKLLTDPNRMRYGDGDGKMVEQFYVCGPEEMYERFPGHADAVARSQEIADGVAIELDFKKRHFPVFTPPGKKTPENYLRELCAEGLRVRYGDAPSAAVLQRLEHELGIICRMGFASYFLIVWDFVRFAREQGIPASARGSACGALVSYVLQLSHVDPLEYDLLFERFLDPNRSEAPDIDIDFCQDRREEVIAYVKQKYGEASVAQIATFGTMAARAAIKDVGRVLDVPLDRVNYLTNLVPKTLHITLDEALAQEPQLKKEYDTDPQVRQLIDIARKLEGTNRQTGIHAAGVVIANGPLTDYVPVHRAERKSDEGASRGSEPVMATQWVMGDLEKVGLLKMDFLGLRTLTLLDNAVRLIKKTRGETIDLYKLPLDDPETYQLLQRGDAKGVFQLESDGIRELLKRMKPDSIRDIVAIMALYRPGPLQGGMVDAYVNRKHGREQPDYPHPVMEEVLAETYGVMVYQEQIMRILNRLGGIELSSAYACIKAISKKKQEIIDQRQADFFKGSQERGLDEGTCREIWDRIIVFAGYGFNKCLVGETALIDAETGERKTIEALFRERPPFVVHALGEDGRLHPRRVTDVVWNGRKQVYRLRTAQGKVIVGTDNHPFRTLDGWTLLRDLKPGDRVAAPRRLAVAGGESWPRHEIVALAGLIAEGNTCHPTSLYFYGNDRVLVEDFAEAARGFPETVVRVDARKGGRRLEVCVNTGRDGSVRKAIQARLARADSAVSAGEDSEPVGLRCGAFRWAERLGIVGKKARAKYVPAGVFRLCDSDLELFLGRLWAGDGFLADESLAVPYYATSSEQLARDVQTLLLRLGIVSGVHAKMFKYRGTLVPGYTVHLLGGDSIETFARRLGPHCLGREEDLARLVRHLEATQRGLTSKDTVPPEVRRWVDEERRQAGLTWKELERRSGVSTQDFLGNGRPHKRGFRRSTIGRLAAFFGSRRLSDLATSDVFWDRVVSIEPAGVQDTYDLTVADDHNFVADGLVVHNSHTAAYAEVGYQTAYLKAHYPAEFMAALLSSEIEDGNKRDIMVDHIADARRLGVDVLPPDVNASDPDFSVVEGKILFGLTAIKGIGRAAAEDVVRARTEGGRFRDFFDFCERIDSRTVGRGAIERLIKAGAFDTFGRRSQLWHVLGRALQAASERQEDRRKGQRSLFDAFGGDGAAAAELAPEALPDLPEWPETEKLKYEKEALDFYFSSHPLAQHEDDIRRFATHSVGQMPDLADGQEVIMGGMLTGVRFRNTQKARNGNSRYVLCTIEDFTGSMKCVMWPDDLARHKDDVYDDRVCFIRATVNKKRDDPVLVLTRILSIEEAQRELTKGLVLQLRLGDHDEGHVDAIGRVLQRSPGSCPVFLTVRDRVGKRGLFKLSADFNINPATVAVGELETLLGPGSVKFSGPANGSGNGRNGR
jgi:DNA polymerase-3 subunit alpha